jgi:hypothetical protein
MTLVGLTALSVFVMTRRSTPVARTASMTFETPRMFVRTVLSGAFSDW